MKVFGSKFLALVVFATGLATTFSHQASAQEQQTGRLFDSSATAAANARLAEKSISTSRGFRGVLNFRDDLVDDLRFDDFDTLLVTSTTQNDTSLVKGISYMNYLDTVERVSGFDEDFDRDTAGRLAVYQSARSVSSFVLNSNFSEDYKRLVNSLRKIQDTLSLRISKDQSLGYGSGRTPKFSKSNRLMELRLHASPQSGLEPRLLIGENTTLRYSPFDQEALIAYEFDF